MWPAALHGLRGSGISNARDVDNGKHCNVSEGGDGTGSVLLSVCPVSVRGCPVSVRGRSPRLGGMADPPRRGSQALQREQLIDLDITESPMGHTATQAAVPNVASTHTHDTTQAVEPGTGGRNLGLDFAVESSTRQLGNGAFAIAEANEDTIDSILGHLMERDSRCPEAIIIPVSTLCNRGLRPQQVEDLLHGSATCTLEARRVQRALELEGQHADAAIRDEQRDAVAAVAAIDPTGTVDVPSICKARVPYTCPRSPAGPAASTAEDDEAHSKLEELVGKARLLTRGARSERALATASAVVPAYLLRETRELIETCHAFEGDSLALLETACGALAVDAETGFIDVIAEAINLMYAGCLPLVAWAVAYEQRRSTQRAIAAHAARQQGSLLPPGMASCTGMSADSGRRSLPQPRTVSPSCAGGSQEADLSRAQPFGLLATPAANERTWLDVMQQQQALFLQQAESQRAESQRMFAASAARGLAQAAVAERAAATAGGLPPSGRSASTGLSATEQAALQQVMEFDAHEDQRSLAARLGGCSSMRQSSSSFEASESARGRPADPNLRSPRRAEVNSPAPAERRSPSGRRSHGAAVAARLPASFQLGAGAVSAPGVGGSCACVRVARRAPGCSLLAAGTCRARGGALGAGRH